MKLALQVNGAPIEFDVDATDMLLDVLRRAGLTGTKEGCGVGVCGACTVLVGDRPVSSCLFMAPCAEGADVWTVEGVTRDDPRLVEAFVAHEGMQCGICTSGQVMSAAALARTEVAGDVAIRSYLAGNLCRCTGYVSIVESVKAYLER